MISKGKKVDLVHEEYSTTNSANELIIIPRAKRRAIDEGSVPKKKDATGGKKNRNFAVEREKEKQEELFASLAQYQLDTNTIQQLSSSVHMQDKQHQSQSEEPNSPNKLKFHLKKIEQQKTIHQKERIQENYYPTDEESSDEEIPTKTEQDTTEPMPTVSQPIVDITAACEVSLDDEDAQAKKRTKKNKIKIIKSRVEDDDDEETVANAPRESIQIQEKADRCICPPESTASSINHDGENSSAKDQEKQGVRHRKYVLVNRDRITEEKRAQLPIYAEEIPIVETINDNIVTVVCGETGSGKTTQIPQFLYEAGYTSEGQIIGITEPRRVAAISMAQRVGEELGLPDVVSYQIRYEGTRSEKTKILFMTDGVLMKEMEADIMLNKYSAILIDEAHERSMYSDVLIGMLSRIAPLRAKTKNPLKLIIMSATLRLQDFLHERLFPFVSPKVIKVDARQFPVTVHFEKKTPNNYIAAAFRKTCRIHESLPNGTILIFVSGQQEVRQLIDKFKSRYPIRYEKTKSGEMLLRGTKKWKKAREDEAQHLKLEDYKNKEQTQKKFDGEDLLESGVGGDMWDDFDEEFLSEDDPLVSTLPAPPSDVAPLYCLPLYSLLSTEKQRRVFEPPPVGARMCVVATNVAETSLTIPGVRYVVDTGFEKKRLYDPITGVSQFVVSHVSQASADQRAGRAGRIAAGHAYRLYSSAVFQDFDQFSRPEIMDKPADQLVLHLKSMNIVKVVNFPFPSAPKSDVLEAAEKRLIKMGALSVTTKNDKTEARITSLGKTLAVFPLAPAYAKVIAMANQHGLLPHAISLISALSVREPLVSVSSLRGSTEEETKNLMTEVLKLRRSWCGKGPTRRLGDLLVLLKAVSASEEVKMDPMACSKIGLRYKAMQEVRRLRLQLTNIVNSSFNVTDPVEMKGELNSPTDAQAQMLRQIMVAGLADCLAKRVDRAVTDEEIPRGAYQTTKLKEYVFIDPCSVIYTEEPDYVIYQDIIQLGDKKCMQTIMTVDHEWLPRLAEAYCNFGEMDKDQEPKYNKQKDEIVKSVSVSFGPLEWALDPVDKPIPRDIMLYRYFAMFFLQGVILPKLAEYVPKMLAPPSIMVRSWAKLQKRTEALLNKLVDKEIHTRAALIEEFNKNENFLLEEYLQWLPESLHSSVTLMWPPLEQKTSKMGRNKIYK